MRLPMIHPRVCLIKSRRYPLASHEVVDGGTLNVYKLVQALLSSGFGVDVFTRLEPGEEPVAVQGGVTLIRIPYDRSTAADTMERDFQESESFVAALVRNRYFRPQEYLGIHTHHWTSTVNLSAWIPFERKLFHTPHLLAREKTRFNGLAFPRQIEAAEREILHRADAVFALSAHEAAVIESYYQVSRSKIYVAPNGVSRRFLQLRLPNSRKLRNAPLLFIGRLCKQKGVDLLVRAIGELGGRGFSPKACIVGGSYGEPAYEQGLHRYVEARNLNSGLHLAGQVPHRRIPAFMRRSGIFVQPSRYESQGVAILEAMAAGRAVIATDLPAVREYITPGLNGFLVRAEDPQSIADSILQVVENPSATAPMLVEARLCASQFTWAATWKTMIPILTGNPRA